MIFCAVWLALHSTDQIRVECPVLFSSRGRKCRKDTACSVKNQTGPTTGQVCKITQKDITLLKHIFGLPPEHCFAWPPTSLLQITIHYNTLHNRHQREPFKNRWKPESLVTPPGKAINHLATHKENGQTKGQSSWESSWERNIIHPATSMGYVRAILLYQPTDARSQAA